MTHRDVGAVAKQEADAEIEELTAVLECVYDMEAQRSRVLAAATGRVGLTRDERRRADLAAFVGGIDRVLRFGGNVAQHLGLRRRSTSA